MAANGEEPEEPAGPSPGNAPLLVEAGVMLHGMELRRTLEVDHVAEEVCVHLDALLP